jgi:hypothetical protein
MARLGARRWPWLVLGAVGVCSFALGIAGATAQSDPAVVEGLDAVAVSDGMGQTMGDPNTQPYPVAKGDIAHTEATLFNGPTGYALASTAWPGPLAANAGSLAVLLGGPSQAGQANYSGRAEAFGGGPNDATAPGMTAHAKGGQAEATAGAQKLESSQGQTTGDVYTRSYSEFAAGALQSTSSCTASNLGFAGGAVTIGSVHTEANAVTTGTSSDAGGRTLVSGTKIGGQDATVDENGVRFTDPATAPIGEQVLSNFGMSMYVAAPRQDPKTPTSASYKSGSLVVIWDPPGTDYGYTYEVCGSDASVELRTGLAFVPVPPIDPGPVSVDVPSEPGDAAFTASFPLRPIATPAASTPAGRVAAPVSIGPMPVGFVRHLSIVPYLIGILSVVVAGLGLGRAREAALAPRAAAVACPLEGARS